MDSGQRRRQLQDRCGFLKPTPLTEGLMAFGFECDDGWLDILEDLFAGIEEVVKKDKLTNFRVEQVKEKFGGLRVYVEGGNDEIEKLIDDAEKRSFETCEKCGKQGKLRDRAGWYTTLCNSCAK